MSLTSKALIGQALASWIIADVDASNDFAREGLPDLDPVYFLQALADDGRFSSGFSVALVGYSLTDGELAAIASAAGLGGLQGFTTDLHIATAWRNDRAKHQRIIALARGYNPSVHGLGFFARASSSQLAWHLIEWARSQPSFRNTPQHRSLLEALQDRPNLAGLRSLEAVARFLAAWSKAPDGDIDAPREALPKLGLLQDPRLFEANDLGKELARNLKTRELVTTLAPGEIRQKRARAERYKSAERKAEILAALDHLEAFRRGEEDAVLTIQEADLVVRPPRDSVEMTPVQPDADTEMDIDDEDQIAKPDTRSPDIVEEAMDALISGNEVDLEAIGSALDDAWKEFDQNGERLAATATTSQGAIPIEVQVDNKMLDWAEQFCSVESFGGLLETDVIDLRQALDRYAEFDPVFIDPQAIWTHNGQVRSFEDLLAGWDRIIGEPSEGVTMVEAWQRFTESRARLIEDIRPLIVHPREWLDTHPTAREACGVYLDAAKFLYAGVQRHYRSVWNQSQDWAQATIDALLSLDIIQVKIANGSRKSAKAVMLPLHPLHLWRYQRLGAVLRDFAVAHPLTEEDRKALAAELRRPEQFLSVVRTGATPNGMGLNQLLPVANDLNGLATFENFHNAVSSVDGIETLITALGHYVLLYPNHTRPLRVALINPPEPARILERIVKLIDERNSGSGSVLRIEIEIFATGMHSDRLVAAATLDSRAQDPVYEKIASGLLDLRVNARLANDLTSLVESGLEGRCYHVAALFDGSAISIRRRKVERLLPMSPFCVRNEIVIDSLLGNISLEPHPGEPPFSDFVMMIQELEREQRDSTMYASADANGLRSAIDTLVMGEKPLAHWALLGDRALPDEDGMRSVRLLARKEGQRELLLCAADHGRLARLMELAFESCNLTVSAHALDHVLRLGANLLGAGLLDMIKKQSGQPDHWKVIGFIGMMLAARNLRKDDPDCLVAAIDSPIARLWLRLGPQRSSERCDLLAIRRASDGSFRLTCIEVKTTKDATLADEADRVERAAGQIDATAQVIQSALSGDDRFSEPRLEMLKEVLVRAAAARWGDPASDAERRRRWGPWLAELFAEDGNVPPVRVDGEVVVVKLRSAEAPRSRGFRGTSVPITVQTITEALAEELLSMSDLDPLASERVKTIAELPVEADVMARQPEHREEAHQGNAGPRKGKLPVAVSAGETDPAVEGSERQDHTVDGDASDRSGMLPQSSELSAAENWPPPLNSLGMIGQIEAAQELADLAEMSKGWGKRFPDKLLVGPAGVGKSTVARRMGENLLGLTPILFNGADLRRPDMIVDRLAELNLIPTRRSGTVIVAPCLIFIDEVHAIATSVATALLSALDDRRTTTVGNIIYSFQDAVFLLATTDPGKLTEAFLSRPTRTTLRSYTLNEMAGIVWLHAKNNLQGAELSREACIEIAARMQCRPRPSVNILDPLVAHFYGRTRAELKATPSHEAVAERITAQAVANWFEASYGIDANGITPLQRQMLELLARRRQVSEDELRQALGISNRGDFLDTAEYLTRLGLMQVSPRGRSLTGDGLSYLKSGGAIDLRDRISRQSG